MTYGIQTPYPDEYRALKTPILLVLGYFLLITSWAVSNPPSAAPDEYAHYLRAVGAGRGELAPDKREGPFLGEGAESKASSWQRMQTRLIRVTGRHSPEPILCNTTEPRLGWACPPVPPVAPDQVVELRTWVGTYPPYAYVVPGFFMRLGSDAVWSLLLGRLVSGFTAAVLIGLAGWVLWDRTRKWICLLGLIGAATPMVLFTGSGLTASGPEIAAGVCFVACLMRLARPDQEPVLLVWVTAAIAGVILVISRDLGILWLGVSGSIFLGLAGWRFSWSRLTSGGKPALLAVSAVMISVIAALVWQLKVQVRPNIGVATFSSGVRSSLHVTKEILRQEIGVFGALNTVMPALAYAAWAILLGVLGLLALMVGTARERIVLLFATAVAWMLPIVLESVQQQVGFGAQGRHVLPISVAVPLVAGEILYRNSERLGWLKVTRPVIWFSLTAAIVHFVGWYANGKQIMFGREGGPLVFWEDLQSVPPLGWALWAAVAGAGACLMGGFGFGAAGGDPIGKAGAQSSVSEDLNETGQSLQKSDVTS